MTESYAIGIDLGTTYSCVGVYRNNSVEIIPNRSGNRTTPSWVSFGEETIEIGEGAKSLSIFNPLNTINDIKRLMGRKFSDPMIQKDINTYPFKIVKSNDDRCKVEVTYKNEIKQYSPEEISAMILTFMKEQAEAYLGQKVTKAVITVPAYFNDAQRQATKDAGTIAGLQVLRIINEPTAASIAYGLDKEITKEKNVLIFDYGGGTLDISVLTLENGVFEVKSCNGNTRLGGTDLDERLIEYCLTEFHKKHKIDLRAITDKEKLGRIKNRLHLICEQVKRRLSSSLTAQIEVDSLHDGIDFDITLTRAKFEEMSLDLFKKTIEPIDNALRDAKLDKSSITDIILVGGSSKIPKVQELLAQYFNKTVGDLNKTVNCDEAVSYGAAIQAAILTGVKSKKLDELLLMDISPLSLGLETAGQMMAVLIKRNSTIPTKKTEFFSTYSDYQQQVSIKIYEGERASVRDCNLLGQFELSGIPPARRGEPKIEVAFDLDANGILNVSAEIKCTNIKNKITITNNRNRLSKEEVDRMLEEAEKNKEEDNKYREKMDAKHNLDNLIQSIKNTLNDEKLKNKFSEEDKKILNTKIEEIQHWLNENTKATKKEYDEKLKEFEQIFTPIMKKIYESSNEQQEESIKGPKISEVNEKKPEIPTSVKPTVTKPKYNNVKIEDID